MAFDDPQTPVSGTCPTSIKRRARPAGGDRMQIIKLGPTNHLNKGNVGALPRQRRGSARRADCRIDAATLLMNILLYNQWLDGLRGISWNDSASAGEMRRPPAGRAGRRVALLSGAGQGGIARRAQYCAAVSGCRAHAS